MTSPLQKLRRSLPTMDLYYQKITHGAQFTPRYLANRDLWRVVAARVLNVQAPLQRVEIE